MSSLYELLHAVAHAPDDQCLRSIAEDAMEEVRGHRCIDPWVPALPMLHAPSWMDQLILSMTQLNPAVLQFAETMERAQQQLLEVVTRAMFIPLEAFNEDHASAVLPSVRGGEEAPGGAEGQDAGGPVREVPDEGYETDPWIDIGGEG